MSSRAVILWAYYQHYHLARLATLQSTASAKDWEVIGLAAGRQGAAEDFHVIQEASIDRAPKYLGGAHGHLNSTEVTAALLRELDTIQPQVVFVPGYGFRVSRAALRWCRKHRAGAVMMFESKEDDAHRWWVKEYLKSYWVKKADCAFCGGQLHADYARKLGMSAQRIFSPYSVVDNAFWTERAALARAQRHPEQPPVMISVGRFIPKKGLPDLIAAFSEFKAQDQQGWRLSLLGDGPDRALLENEINRKGLSDCVEFAGYCSPEETARRMGLADIFILPSNRGEQWGLVVNEAMAAGLPVIVGRACGCVPDLIGNDETGLTFASGSVAELIAAMTRLARDSTLRDQLAVAGQRRIQAYSLDAFASAALAAAERATTHARER